ncbi:hypothetical protein BgiBS90_021001, partial [Biomphalaria glabrata]
ITKKDKTNLEIKYSVHTKELGTEEQEEQKSDNYKDETDQSSNTGDDSKECKLFICAVLKENFKLALTLWRTLS